MVELLPGETTMFALGPCPSADDMDKIRNGRGDVVAVNCPGNTSRWWRPYCDGVLKLSPEGDVYRCAQCGRERKVKVEYSWWYRLRRWPRWLNRVWAFVGAYFWIACPLCGGMFGGHEWGKWGEHAVCIRQPQGNDKGVCWRCVNKEGVY